MKVLIRQICAHPFCIRVFEWAKAISITASTQLLVQLIGLAGGILVIRLLPTSEYGLYTLANTMLGTMIVLADGGISNSVLGLGGKVWTDKKKLGAVLVSGFDSRRSLATVSLCIAIPVLFYLLKHHEAGWLTSIVIVIALIPAFFAALAGSLLSIGPALHQNIAPLQKVQAGVSLGRLAMLILTLFIFPLAYVAIISASIPQIIANRKLRKISTVYADWGQKSDPAIKKEIFNFVKRILPGSIYYCLSGQLTVWLISFLGTTTAVAQIGALGRLSMVLNLFSSVFGALIVPRFARLIHNKGLLLRRFLQVQLILIVLFAIIILLVYMFPVQLLWVLGKNYSGLEKELVLSVAGSCISLFAGLLFSLYTSRSWAVNPLISIPLIVAAVICGALLIDVSTVSGILRFNIFVSAIEALIYTGYCVFKIYDTITLTALQ